MKKTLILFAVVMASISCSNAQKKEFSKEALDGKLRTPENTEITFKEIIEKHKGKTVLIEVWASWCSDCVKAMPRVKELQASNPEVDYVFISMDKAMDKWQDGIEKHEIKGDHYWVNDEKGMKGTFGKSIDLDWIPRYIVLNKKGEVKIYRAIETDFEKIDKELKQ
jgi:thiol-disulfide isomerase/thioredoxin